MLDGPPRLCYNSSLRRCVLRILACPKQEGMSVLRELAAKNKVIGVKQTRRALRDGKAAMLFLARDADPALTDPLEELCRQQKLPVDRSYTLEELGRAAGIQVGAAVIAVLR